MIAAYYYLACHAIELKNQCNEMLGVEYADVVASYCILHLRLLLIRFPLLRFRLCLLTFN